MKKIVSLLLAMMMVVAMCAGAMAEDATKYTITINNAQEGYTYEAYQIFAGDLMVDEENKKTVLSNITWGAGVDGDALLAELKKLDVFKNCTDAASVAEVLAQYTEFDNETAKAFAAAAGKHLASVSASGSDKIEGLAAGYYLIKNSAVATDGAYTRFMLEVVKDVTVNHKGDAPSSQKKVKDINDTDGKTTDWQDSADYDIGDAVPFQLSATLPTNYADYTKYQLTFHDTQSVGLTFNENSVVVKIGETTLTKDTDYTVAVPGETCEGGCTFEVKFADLTKVKAAAAGSVITVEYTATLNENAVLGSAGNPNTSYITYSNNPNWDGTGNSEEGKTPEDKVIVFTYKVVVNKVDENKKPLTGAGFTLYKKVPAATGSEPIEWIQIGKELTGKTTFEWEGLDDGDYKLVETTTPAGYNTIADIEFTITAEHDEEKDDPQLTKLEGGDLFTGVVSTGTLTTEVVNKQGATLPETGGMGTTMMYIGGGLLVAFAVIMLATKRRMNAAE